MARNGKSISVKIATPKVIKALETRLAELEKNYATQGENEAKHTKAMEKWRKEVGKWAIENFSKAENLRTNYRSWNNNLNVDFDIVVKQGDFPQEPEKDFEVIHTHSYNEMKEELTNAIRILKMTDEEVVSTSTYNAIARYL
jgi:DNA repair exonuclease SbcCD ATPase subunit